MDTSDSDDDDDQMLDLMEASDSEGEGDNEETGDANAMLANDKKGARTNVDLYDSELRAIRHPIMTASSNTVQTYSWYGREHIQYCRMQKHVD
jgi:hypothetical protein